MKMKHIVTAAPGTYPDFKSTFSGATINIDRRHISGQPIDAADMVYHIKDRKGHLHQLALHEYYEIRNYCLREGLQLSDITWEFYKYMCREEYLIKCHERLSEWIEQIRYKLKAQ